MKKVFLTAVIGLVLPSAAIAADLYAKTAPASYAAYDWSGIYIGGHVGGARQNTQMTDPSSCNAIAGFFDGYYGCTGGYVAYDGDAPFTGNIPTQNMNDTSFLGGLQAGANYQIGRLVLGTEFDFSWTSLNSSATAGLPLTPYYSGYANSYYPNNPTYDNESFSSRTNWIATSTTRIGVAADNWLLYGKAGAAWENAKYMLSHAGCYYCGYVEAGYSYDPFSWSGMTNDTRLGWTVGAGLEWAFARNWTAKVEYDYMNFGEKQESFSGVANGGYGSNYNCYYGGCASTNIAVSVFQQVSEVKAGINYKFDPGWFLFF